MTLKDYMWAAVDIVIDFAKENDIKYRHGDFEIIKNSEYKRGGKNNVVSVTGDSVTVALSFGFERTKAKLRAKKKSFADYSCCDIEWDGVYFDFSFDEINELHGKGKQGWERYRKDLESTPVVKEEKAVLLGETKEILSAAEVASESQILRRLTAAANEKGVTLTYTHKVFYLRLLSFASRTGRESADGVVVSLSVQQLADALQVPLKTTTQSLNRLTACGGVLRTKGEKTFPRSPAETTIVKSFYEK